MLCRVITLVVVEGGVLIPVYCISCSSGGLRIVHMLGNVDLQLNVGRESTEDFVMLS